MFQITFRDLDSELLKRSFPFRPFQPHAPPERPMGTAPDQRAACALSLSILQTVADGKPGDILFHQIVQPQINISRHQIIEAIAMVKRDEPKSTQLAAHFERQEA